MSLPDQLTVARVAAVPIVVLLFAWDFPNHDYWATAVFVVAMATDQIDGWLARRRGVSSALGKLLDPVADKVLVLAALVMLVGEGVAPGWMIALIVVREILVSGLRLAAVERGVVLGARDLGRAKTWAQAIGGDDRRARGCRILERRRRMVGSPRRPRRDLGVGARLRPGGTAGAARRERVTAVRLLVADCLSNPGSTPRGGATDVAVRRRRHPRSLERGEQRLSLGPIHRRSDIDVNVHSG